MFAVSTHLFAVNALSGLLARHRNDVRLFQCGSRLSSKKLWPHSSTAAICTEHWRLEFAIPSILYGVHRWVVAKEVEQAQDEAQKRFPGKNVTLSQVSIICTLQYHQNHVPKVETRVYCPQAFLSLDSQCRDAVFELKWRCFSIEKSHLPRHGN